MRLRKLWFFPILLVMVLISGCTHTTVNSFVDPEYRFAKFSRLMVYMPYSDIGLRQSSELKEVSVLSELGVKGVPSYEILVPTRTYSAEQVTELLTAHGIDGVLEFRVLDAQLQQSYVPPTTSTSGTVYVLGNTYDYHQSTQTYGVYFIQSPMVQFEVSLYDAQNGKKAWIAQLNSHGIAFSTFEDLIDAVSSKVIKKLDQDGLLFTLRGFAGNQ